MRELTRGGAKQRCECACRLTRSCYEPVTFLSMAEAHEVREHPIRRRRRVGIVRGEGQSAREHVGLEMRHECRASGCSEYIARVAAHGANTSAQDTALVAPHVSHQPVGMPFPARATYLVFAQGADPLALDVIRPQIAAEQHIRDGAKLDRGIPAIDLS